MATKQAKQQAVKFIRSAPGVLSVRLSETAATRSAKAKDPDVTMHYSARGKLVQLDFAGVDKVPSKKSLKYAVESGMLWMSLVNAAERLGVHPATLRRAARSGELRAMRVNREWITTVAWLEEYTTRRRPVGRPRGAKAALTKAAESTRAGSSR